MNAPTNDLAETDPLKIEPPSSDNINTNINSINTASKNVNAPMVSFGNPSNLETELDLGTITDPNNVKTELSKDKNVEKEAPEMEGNDDPYDTKGKFYSKLKSTYLLFDQKNQFHYSALNSSKVIHSIWFQNPPLKFDHQER